MSGFIKDYRAELKSDIWMMPPLYHRVWQYLKYKVNHTPNRIPMENGEFFDIKAGQHLTSVRSIAQGVGYYEGLKWKEPNPKTVSTILSWLEKHQMIAIDRGKGNRQYTLITLSNWDLYQQKTSEGNGKETPDGEAREQSADIKKNDKECFKNEKENDDDKGVRMNPFIFYEQEGFGTLSSFVGDTIGDLIDRYHEAPVLAAMQEAVVRGARNLKYVEAILKNPNKGKQAPDNVHPFTPKPKQDEHKYDYGF